MLLKLALTLAICLVSTLAGQVQLPDLQLPPNSAVVKSTVKHMFIDSYNAYRRVSVFIPLSLTVNRMTAHRKYAWGHDDLLPVSNSSSDGRNGWGASIIDGMGTMCIMGLDVSRTLWMKDLTYITRLNFRTSSLKL